MSFKYRNSILFNRPNTTTQQIALQTILFEQKEKLHLNTRTSSHILIPSDSVQRLNVRQARTIENLASRVKKVSFHKIYQAYQKGLTPRQDDKKDIYNPESLRKYSSGNYNRTSNRIKKKMNYLDDSIKRDLMEYFDRRPEQQTLGLDTLIAKKSEEKRKLRGGLMALSTRQTIRSRQTPNKIK